MEETLSIIDIDWMRIVLASDEPMLSEGDIEVEIPQPLKDAFRQAVELYAKGESIIVSAATAASPWCTPEQAGQILQKHPDNIRRMCSRGTLQGAKKFGGEWRIPRAAIMSW
jgi:hypothetical protein